MDYKFRDLAHLVEANGEVETLGQNVPEILRKPLVLGDSELEVRMSGRRTALIQIGKHWHKLKGCNPKPGLFSASDFLGEKLGAEVIALGADPVYHHIKPKGSMCSKSAKSEIKEQELFIEKLAEFKINAPLYPVARYDYDLEGMEDRCCVVSLTTGDFRLPEFKNALSKMQTIIPDYEKEFNKMYWWLGFTQYITKQAFGFLGKESNGVFNYVLHETNGGYALSRVDYPSRTKTNNLLKPEPTGYIQQKVIQFMKEIGQENRISDFIFNPIVQPSETKEGLFKEGRDYVMHIPPSKFINEEKMWESFNNGFEGEAPEPISKKFICAALESPWIKWK